MPLTRSLSPRRVSSPRLSASLPAASASISSPKPNRLLLRRRTLPRARSHSVKPTPASARKDGASVTRSAIRTPSPSGSKPIQVRSTRLVASTLSNARSPFSIEKGGPTGTLKVSRTSFSLTFTFPRTTTSRIGVPSSAGRAAARGRGARSVTPAASSLRRISGMAAFVAS